MLTWRRLGLLRRLETRSSLRPAEPIRSTYSWSQLSLFASPSLSRPAFCQGATSAKDRREARRGRAAKIQACRLLNLVTPSSQRADTITLQHSFEPDRNDKSRRQERFYDDTSKEKAISGE